jgi:hypothetical protein
VSDVSYEIYVKQKGSDRWMLDSRYGTSDKQEAIDDAKEIARQSHIEAVRVVREIHNAETNTTRDTVVFTTSGKKGADGGGGPKRRGDDDDDDGPSPGGRRSSPADDDDGPSGDDEDDEPAPKRGWFKRKAKDEDGDEDGDKPAAAAAAPTAPKPPPVPRSPAFRAYKTVVKFVVIVMVSFGFATASTFGYVRFLA